MLIEDEPVGSKNPTLYMDEDYKEELVPIELKEELVQNESKEEILEIDSPDDIKLSIFNIADIVQKVMSFLPASNLVKFMHVNSSYCKICKRLLQRPGVGTASLSVPGRRLPKTSFSDAVERTILLALDRISSRPNVAIIFCTPKWGTHSINLPCKDFEKVLKRKLGNCQVLGGISTGIIGKPKNKQMPYEVERNHGVSVTLMRLPTETKVFLCRSFKQPERCLGEFDGGDTAPHLRVPRGGTNKWAGAYILLSVRHRGMVDVLREWLQCPTVGYMTSTCSSSEIKDLLTASFVKPSGRSVTYASGKEFVDFMAGLAIGASSRVAVKTFCSEGLEPISEPLPIRNIDPLSLRITDIGGNQQELTNVIMRFHAVGYQFSDDPTVYMGFASEGNLYIPRQLVDAKKAVPVSIRFFETSDAASRREIKARLRQQKRVMGASGFKPLGALLFQCCARGEQFHRKPDAESEVFFDALGGHANLGGCFCNGEIGPSLSWSPNNMILSDIEDNSLALQSYTSAFSVIYCK